MKKRIVLIPVDGTPVGLEAVRRVLRDEREALLRIELLNVQPLLNRHIAGHIVRPDREAWRLERSSHALEPARRMVAEAGVPCTLHAASGPVAEVVSAVARRLRVDEIVLATRRQSPLARLLGRSLSTRLLDKATVPVRVIPSASRSAFDRLAVPAGLGIGLVAWLVATGD